VEIHAPFRLIPRWTRLANLIFPACLGKCLAPEADVVSQLQDKNAFLANLAVFKMQDKMAGALLSQSA